mmetsp:Transcript_11868/g.33826  ORF Transcript_11868/g.33826 Transcript_11868/m.33826 type:complete len:338 (+) Transcript_11868:339-1352(+)
MSPGDAAGATSDAAASGSPDLPGWARGTKMALPRGSRGTVAHVWRALPREPSSIRSHGLGHAAREGQTHLGEGRSGPEAQGRMLLRRLLLRLCNGVRHARADAQGLAGESFADAGGLDSDLRRLLGDLQRQESSLLRHPSCELADLLHPLATVELHPSIVQLPPQVLPEGAGEIGSDVGWGSLEHRHEHGSHHDLDEFIQVDTVAFLPHVLDLDATDGVDHRRQGLKGHRHRDVMQPDPLHAKANLHSPDALTHRRVGVRHLRVKHLAVELGRNPLRHFVHVRHDLLGVRLCDGQALRLDGHTAIVDRHLLDDDGLRKVRQPRDEGRQRPDVKDETS